MKVLEARRAPAPAAVRPVAARPAAWRRRVLVGALFAVALLVMLRPTWHSLTTTLTNLGDPALHVWNIEWGRHALLNDPLGVFDADIFFPNGRTLAYSDNMLAVVPIGGAVRVLGGSWALSLNVTVLVLIAFALAATYSLTRWLVGRTEVAVVAALAYGFTSFVFSHLGHAQLLTLGMFPLAFLLLFRTLEQGRARDAVLTGLTTLGFVFGAVYYAAIWMVCAAVVVVLFVLLRRFRLGGRRWRALLVVVLVSGVIALPASYPYLRLQDEVDLTRPMVPAWGLKADDLLTPVSGSILYPFLDHAAEGRDTRWEHELFPGFAVLGLGAAGAVALVLALRRRGTGLDAPDLDAPDVDAPGVDAPGVDALGVEARRGYLLLLAVAGLAAFAVAAGPTVLGVRFTPFRALYHLAPGFNGVRVASRLAAPGLLALVVLAAYGLAYFTASRPARLRAVVAGGVAVFVLLEMAVPLHRVVLPDDRATLAVYHELDRRPPGAVAELPMASPADGGAWANLEAPRMIYASIDWNDRVNGYSGYWPPSYFADREVINRFPDRAAVARLRALHVRYVVLHVGGYAGYQQLTEGQARSIVASLPAGATATRAGNAWLVDLGSRRRVAGAQPGGPR